MCILENNYSVFISGFRFKLYVIFICIVGLYIIIEIKNEVIFKCYY